MIIIDEQLDVIIIDDEKIILTAYPEYSFDAWDTGACGFLLKPISEEAVKRQLAKLRFSLMTGGTDT